MQQREQRDSDKRRHVRYQLVNMESMASYTNINPANDNDCMQGSIENMETCAKRRESDDEEGMREYSIAFLGSCQVGKTSIIQQFLHHNIDNAYTPSTTVKKYHKAVFMDGKIYDLTLRDCPGVTSFPESPLAEFSTYKGYGMHNSQV